MRRRDLITLMALPAIARAQAEHPLLRLIRRPSVPLVPVTKDLSVDGTITQQHFTFASEANQRVPGILLRPQSVSARLPVVVAMHGTGGNKEGQLPLLRRLAQNGFAAVAIDGRYHGERTMARKGSVEYVDAILHAYRGSGEYPFLYDTVWDVIRLIDYLATRSDIDSSHIGAIGFSKGGMELYLAAAIDRRIQVAVPCIGVQSFRWALDNDAWQSRAGTFRAALDAAAKDEGSAVDAAFLRRFYDRVAPGIHSDFDGPRMLPRIASRPLLVINGDSDARTPLPGLMQCIDAAKSAYTAARAEDHFRFLLQPRTGHRVNPDAMDAAIEWFLKWNSSS